MNVSGAPTMTELLSLLGGAQAGAFQPGPDALSALAPLLRGLNGGGPDLGALAALAPLLRTAAGGRRAAEQAACSVPSPPPKLPMP